MLLGITETVLRDANQSLLATRLPLGQFVDILETLDRAGYYSLECWGGATFDACIRYLGEDPWERLHVIRRLAPKTKLQMLLRGQSLLGYRHYPDDVVRRFVYQSVENGIDIIRIFDALNDIRNISVATDETLKCGAHPSCAIAYTESPVHHIASYVKLAADMEQLGAKSICVKDMSGILGPMKAYDLIKAIKETVSVPVILHSHCTGGLAYMTYLKAMEAGVDVLDTAISSFSGGTSQPSTEVIHTVANSYGIDCFLKPESLREINAFFSGVINKYHDNGLLKINSLLTDPGVLESQIPGGMYSNLLKQLEELGCTDRFDEVVREIPLVRKDLGYPPLVTPLSQMVVTQSVMNVVSGARYGSLCNEVKSYLRGEYGSPPGEISLDFHVPEAISASGDFGLEQKRLEETYGNACDVLTCLLFPQIGEKFVQNKEEAIAEDESQKPAPKNVDVEPDYDGFIDFSAESGDVRPKHEITAVLPGTVIKIYKSVGDRVTKDEPLLICESMKMENEILSPINGELIQILVKIGDSVRMNENLLVLSSG